MILSLADVNYKAISDSVPADMTIFFASENARTAALPMVLYLSGEYLIFGALFDIVSMCSLILPNAVLVKELPDKVRQIEGVNQALIEIVVEHFQQKKALTHLLEKQMHQLPG